MFRVNDFVACREGADIYYGITGREAVLMVTKIPDEREADYNAKCVRHSRNSDFVGESFWFEKDAFERDFYITDNTLTEREKDEALLSFDWRINGNADYLDVMSKPAAHEFKKCADNADNAFHTFYKSEVYDDSRVFYNNIVKGSPEVYLKQDPVKIFAKDAVVGTEEGLYKQLSFEKTVEGIEEVFIKVPTGVLEKAEETLKIMHKYSEIPYTCDCFSEKHRIIALERNESGRVYYLTNYETSDVFLYTAVWYMETHGIVFPDDVRKAMLACDRLSFLKAANRVFSQYADLIQERRKREMICQFSDGFKEVLAEPLSASLRNIEKQIRVHQKRLEELYVRQRDERARLLFLKNEAYNDEFLDFIKNHNENLVSLYKEGNALVFDVKTYMTYWEDEDYENVRENDIRFKRLPNYMKCLLDDIFRYRSVKLRIEQKFGLDIYECHPFFGNQIRYDPKKGEDYWGMSNPHITEHSCFGTHMPIIARFLSEINILQAYHQAVAACSGITWTDSIVVGDFFDYLKEYEKRNDIKCIESHDGKTLSIMEYAEEYRKETEVGFK